MDDDASVVTVIVDPLSICCPIEDTSVTMAVSSSGPFTLTVNPSPSSCWRTEASVSPVEKVGTVTCSLPSETQTLMLARCSTVEPEPGSTRVTEPAAMVSEYSDCSVMLKL